jgi:hypothetical protein
MSIYDVPEDQRLEFDAGDLSDTAGAPADLSEAPLGSDDDIVYFDDDLEG